MTLAPPSSVFVGVSGASGAPYVLRLVQALAAAGCELQLCLSDNGVLVLEHELELSARGRDAVTAAFLERAGVAAQVYAADDLAAPPASGSSFPDAAVICPCSVSTVAHIALGTTRTLIHRVGDVALKERRPLVVVPRETPLTQIRRYHGSGHCSYGPAITFTSIRSRSAWSAATSVTRRTNRRKSGVVCA
jgi:4-hydroxy-3-polyprenylbenzoate decarboxylase